MGMAVFLFTEAEGFESGEVEPLFCCRALFAACSAAWANRTSAVVKGRPRLEVALAPNISKAFEPSDEGASISVLERKNYSAKEQHKVNKNLPS